MGSNVATLPGGQKIATRAGAMSCAPVDRVAQALEIAQPTLNAAVKLSEILDWLDDRPPVTQDDADEIEAEAKARLAIIPEVSALQHMASLFDDAARKSAPAAWLHLMLGTML